MCTTSLARYLALCISLCIIRTCSSFLFPFEVQEVATKEALCNGFPTRFPEDDHFEFITYKRTPLDHLLQLRKPQATDPASFHEYSSFLRRIYAHPLLLTRSQVQSGTVGPGDERMHRFVTKLATGEPVTVVLLGGSISFGHGVEAEENSWPNRLFNYIEETFPNPKHQLINHAIPATTSSFIAPCAYTMMPENVDLVIAEFTLNDGADDDTQHNKCAQQECPAFCNTGVESPIRQSLERLTRKILTLPSKPAMLYMHAWRGNHPDTPYYYGVEDDYSMILARYGVATLSFRNAVQSQVLRSPALRARFWPDIHDIHPSCAGARAMADLAIGYLMDQLSTVALMMHVQQAVQQTFHINGIQEEKHTPKRLEYADYDHSPLLPALFSGNAGNFSTQCILEDGIQGYVSVNAGFKWVNEGRPESPKWGYVTETSGAHMAVKVPLKDVQFNGEDLVIGVGLLLSWYTKMGIVKLDCLAGCSCAAKEYSTYIKYADWSMTFWRFLEVKADQGSEVCTIGITNLAKTYSEGHKIKVNSLMVSGEMGSLQTDISWIEEGVVDGPSLKEEEAAAASRNLIEVDSSGSSVGDRQWQQRQNATLPRYLLTV